MVEDPFGYRFSLLKSYAAQNFLYFLGLHHLHEFQLGEVHCQQQNTEVLC